MNRTLGLVTGLAVAPALLALSTGCVLPEQVQRLEQSVAELREEVQVLRQSQEATQRQVESLQEEWASSDQAAGREQLAELQVQVAEARRQSMIQEERMREVSHRVDRLSQTVQENRELLRQISQAVASGAAPTVSVPDSYSVPPQATGGESPRGGGVPSPEALYNQAYADFSKGNYALAISGFEEYATRYPDSELADNALYWIGESYFSQGNYGVAIEAFDRLLERYPDSDRAAAANLKKGLAYLQLNRIREAIVQLQYVEQQYPGTDEARIAREKLASMRGGDRGRP